MGRSMAWQQAEGLRIPGRSFDWRRTVAIPCSTSMHTEVQKEVLRAMPCSRAPGASFMAPLAGVEAPIWALFLVWVGTGTITPCCITSLEAQRKGAAPTQAWWKGAMDCFTAVLSVVDC